MTLGTLKPPGGVNTPLGTGRVFYNIVADYGARGGASNDHTPLQNALNAAGNAGGGKVFVPDGTYKSNSGVTLPDNVHLELSPGAVLDFSGCPIATTFISASGTEAATVALTADALAGASSVSIAAGAETGFAAGNWVRIASTTSWDPIRTNTPIGELAQVLSVGVGVVNLRSPLDGPDYTVVAGATISKLSPLHNLKVSGGKIIGGGVGFLQTAIAADRCVRVRVLDTEFVDCEATAIVFIDCVDAWVRDPIVSGSNLSTSGYGVDFVNACQDGGVYFGHFSDCRHAFTTGATGGRKGIARRITVIGSHARDTASTGDAFDTHACSDDISFIDCHVYDGAGIGFNLECPRARVIGCSVNRTVSHGIAAINCTAQASEYLINDNVVNNAGADGIRVAGFGSGGVGSVTRSVNVDDNQIYRAGSVGIMIREVDTWRWKGVSVCGNTIDSPLGIYGIQLLKGDCFTCLGNTLTNIPNTDSGIRVDNIGKSSINGNTIEILGVSGVGVELRNSSVDNSVCGNTVTGGGNGIFQDNTVTYSVIDGNNLRGIGNPINPGTGAGHRIGKNNTGADDVAIVNTDVPFTLTPQTSAEHTLHTGTLTANRAVTLATTAAIVYPGMRFKITRTGAGAFNLNVGSGPLKALATNQWCEVIYDGSNWVLAAFGSL